MELLHLLAEPEANLSKLTKLRIGTLQLQQANIDLSQVVDLLKYCVNLESLDLSHLELGGSDDNPYGALFNNLEHYCSKISNLNVAYNYLGYLNQKDFNELVLCLKGLDLLSINLADTDLEYLSDSNFECLLDTLYHKKSLTELILKDNCLNNYNSFKIECLANFIVVNPYIKKLDLTGVNLDLLEQTKLSRLFRAISYSINLTHLNLSSNDLGEICNIKFDLICQALLKCHTLEYLDISGQYLPEERQNKLLQIQATITNRNNNFCLIGVQPKHAKYKFIM